MNLYTNEKLARELERNREQSRRLLELHGPPPNQPQLQQLFGKPVVYEDMPEASLQWTCQPLSAQGPPPKPEPPELRHVCSVCDAPWGTCWCRAFLISVSVLTVGLLLLTVIALCFAWGTKQ